MVGSRVTAQWPKAVFFLSLVVTLVVSAVFFSKDEYISRTVGLFNTPQLIMQLIMSLVFGGASLYVVLSKKYDEATQKWAFGTIGLILGFWLKP